MPLPPSQGNGTAKTSGANHGVSTATKHITVTEPLQDTPVTASMPRPQRIGRFHMKITLRASWHDPGGNVKRWLRPDQEQQPTLSQGRQLALLDTGTPWQRSAMHNVYISMLMHVPSTCKFQAEPACSCISWVYGHTLVRTCPSRAFLAVHNRRGAI